MGGRRRRQQCWDQVVSRQRIEEGRSAEETGNEGSIKGDDGGVTTIEGKVHV